MDKLGMKSKDYIYLFIYYFKLLASYVPVMPRCHDIHALFNGVFVVISLFFQQNERSTECCHVFEACRTICLMPTIPSA
jgi:hypothetical protein